MNTIVMRRFSLTFLGIALLLFALAWILFGVLSFVVRPKLDPIFFARISAPALPSSGSAQTPAPQATGSPENPEPSPRSIGAATPALPRSFSDHFDRKGVLVETGTAEESDSPHWWVNSGAFVFFDNGTARTIEGDIADEYWRSYYARDNGDETDNGLHPQNILRLIERDSWKDYQQQVYFEVTADEMSKSAYRNESNGLLLFNRYQNENNLYYAGLRVDGAVTIKKKYKGTYYEMAHVQVIPGDYRRSKNISLIPKDTWIGERVIVENLPNGFVAIELFLDIGRTGNWRLAAIAIDDGSSYGGPVLSHSGMAGIRTDFMDVRFSDYSISEIVDTK